MDVVLLARIQFAMTVMFHFIFPAITIGLALLIAISETIRHRTGAEVWDRLAVFWTKLFALTFVVGVATGIVMEFQFGTNWAAYSTFVGDIFGPPLAAEGVMAFFLESGFLGLLLFGRSRIGARLRTFAAWMVAIGSTMSGFWIIVANSWMQTPAGYEVVGGKAVLTDFWAAVFNPSTLPRFGHVIVSSWATAGFLMLGVGAWFLLRRRHLGVARRSLTLGLSLALVASVLMFVTGDRHARQVAETQPAKFAAMQGLYSTTYGAPLILFALPPTQDPSDAPEGPEIQIARLLSFLTAGSFQAAIVGLEAFPQSEWPPIAITFLGYHNMVLLGTLMLLVAAWGAWLRYRHRVEASRRFLWLAVLAIPVPHLAIQLGWMTAEVGRQPWIVYGLMRTEAGVSTAVGAGEVALSIALFGLVYLALFGLWMYLVVAKIRVGPAAAPEGSPEEAEPPLIPTFVPAPAPGRI
ncbi:MAG: cytochrome ubiquinol oxidase subunit I [Chloroflexi bacterium]|nr:cytochrome ubiquinol oxidase subunit I [Chloroflexota bacterium]